MGRSRSSRSSGTRRSSSSCPRRGRTCTRYSTRASSPSTLAPSRATKSALRHRLLPSSTTTRSTRSRRSSTRGSSGAASPTSSSGWGTAASTTPGSRESTSATPPARSKTSTRSIPGSCATCSKTTRRPLEPSSRVRYSLRTSSRASTPRASTSRSPTRRPPRVSPFNASDIVDRSGLVGGLCCGSSPFSAIAASLSAFAHYAVTRLHLADLRTSTSDFVERRFVGRLRDHRIASRTRTAGGPVDPAPPFIYLRVCLALYFRFELVCPPSIHLAFPHLSPAERRFRRVSPVIVT